jgi:peptide deformylase
MTVTELKIRYYGDACLTKKSAPIKEVGPGERLLIQSMFHTMRVHKGIGLAAPQVGINKRLFVADIGEGPIAVINPKILTTDDAVTMEEGCLSMPGVSIEIERPKRIVVEYTDEHNQPVKAEFEELMARVFLHENDHLNGKLILDYADENAREKLIEQYRQTLEGEAGLNGPAY